MDLLLFFVQVELKVSSYFLFCISFYL